MSRASRVAKRSKSMLLNFLSKSFSSNREFANISNVVNIGHWQIHPSHYFPRYSSQSLANIQKRRDLFTTHLLSKYSSTNTESAELSAINDQVNAEFLAKQKLDARTREEILRLSKLNMHSAIRVPNDKAFKELGGFLMRYLGMDSVGIYNFLKLGKDALPVRATALKALDQGCATQIFFSLVALDNISDDVRKIYEKYVNRGVFSPQAKVLVDKFNVTGELSEEEDEKLIDILTSDWMRHQDHILQRVASKILVLSKSGTLIGCSQTTEKLIDKIIKQGGVDDVDEKLLVELVNKVTQDSKNAAQAKNQTSWQVPSYLSDFILESDYKKVFKESPYLADLMVRRGGVCFNHATPTAFNIKKSLEKMQQAGYEMGVLQGPNPDENGAVVQLQQMSNKALDKPLYLISELGEVLTKFHKPMFVEFEKRGFALTPMGQKLMTARTLAGISAEALMNEGLVYCQYGVIDLNKLSSITNVGQETKALETLKRSGVIGVGVTTYEGFLSKSARNIFKSTGNKELKEEFKMNEKTTDKYATKVVGSLLGGNKEYNPIIDQDSLYKALYWNSVVGVLDCVLASGFEDILKELLVKVRNEREEALMELSEIFASNPSIANSSAFDQSIINEVQQQERLFHLKYSN